MYNKEAYNQWSLTYDSITNKTRDVEAKAFRDLLSNTRYQSVIELGCGTGKNTDWLSQIADEVLAVDFSKEMMAVARNKMARSNVKFTLADITKPWPFANIKADLITSSLVLEHVEDLNFIFQQASLHLTTGGVLYVGELHPFKQYEGSKARFATDSGVFTLECFTHHISDYTNAAARNNLSCLSLREWFDEDGGTIPRIVAFLFQKNG